MQQTSLVDYPDKIACIIFTAGCNLRCRFCHNPALVLP
ncbi:4Fe-4S cluster-binding domain-containing protein [Patescibacteria group bacterium]|nr:4Fe-4S cluster-binding domain-containing protein [Patescibacteria group bacterium]